MSLVVIGVGNRWRGDDAAGPAVVDRLAARNLAGVTVMECDGEPTRLLAAWEGAAMAIVVDAVRTGRAPAGSVTRMTPPFPATGGQPGGSSHSFNLGDVYALGAALDRLPGRLVIYGIEADRMAPGVALSVPVSAAVEQVADAVVAELRRRTP